MYKSIKACENCLESFKASRNILSEKIIIFVLVILRSTVQLNLYIKTVEENHKYLRFSKDFEKHTSIHMKNLQHLATELLKVKNDLSPEIRK